MAPNSKDPSSRFRDEPKPYLQLLHKEKSNNPALPAHIINGINIGNVNIIMVSQNQINIFL